MCEIQKEHYLILMFFKVPALLANKIIAKRRQNKIKIIFHNTHIASGVPLNVLSSQIYAGKDNNLIETTSE